MKNTPITHGPRWRDAACSGALVNTVITMSDDGPVPMINMRPVPKKPNAADRFSYEHRYHSEDEPDRLRRVNLHNSAYPKLRDELDRRDSLVNVRAIRKRCVLPRSSRSFRSSKSRTMRCRICREIEERKRETERKTRTSRVFKNRISVRNAATSSMFKCLTSRGCQYFPEAVHRGTSPHTSAVILKMEHEDCPTKEAEEISLNERNNSTTKTDSINSIKQYGGSVASRSSYESFKSMDHEPMVAEKMEDQEKNFP